MLDMTLLQENVPDLSKSIKVEELSLSDIAIIGIALNLPMAKTIEQFWENLRLGRDCVTPFPKSRQKDTDQFLEFKFPDQPIRYREGGYLDQIDQFDPAFFRLSPKEAGLMAPDQRLFLETAWNAIEDAGYGGEALHGSNTGVYLGYSNDGRYGQYLSELAPAEATASIQGNLSSMIGSRVAYLLDLCGPSITIDTACSSSLVAVHMACQGIRSGECDLAIAGSVKTMLLPLETGEKIGIESSDYRTRSFDDASDGTGMGEGVVAVLLKSKNKARIDRDQIYAVIKGSAINQDGNSVGLTAPNVKAQENVLLKAWENAGIDPTTISYIEAHGTGTKLGDPIEIEGITRAFQRFTDQKQFCAIGSVKTNFGHCDHAAGIAGLVKAALSLKFRTLIPNLFFSKPNRAIDFADSPVYVNTELKEWDFTPGLRRSGVSAFGLSGTNCHIVLEEAPKRELSSSGTKPDILTITAKSEIALFNLIHCYKKFLRTNRKTNLTDFCHTANTGRGDHQYRYAVIVTEIDQLLEAFDFILTRKGSTNPEKGIFYGNFRLIQEKQPKQKPEDLYPSELENLTKQANQALSSISDLASLYCQGATIDWKQLYKNETPFKISIPGYLFDHRRCWIEVESVPDKSQHFLSKNENGTKPLDHESSTATIPDGKRENSEKVVLTGRDSREYTATERLVATVWAERLGHETIDILDDYYCVGGDSILAIEIVNAFRQKAGVEITIGEIMEFPILVDFAKLLEERIKGEEKSFNEAIPVISRNESLPLSCSQERLWFLDQLDPGSATYNIPLAIRISGEPNMVAIERSVQTLVDRHESLRTVFLSHSEGAELKILEAIELKVTLVDLSDSEEEDREKALSSQLKQAARESFDLAKGPLLACSVIRLDGEFVLFLNIHHIIADGWSLGVFSKEFLLCYQAILNQREPVLPPMPIQFADFAKWQRNHLNSGVLEKQLNYWTKKLENCPQSLDLPTDFPRPATQTFNGAAHYFVLPKKLSRKLKSFGKEEGITLFMTLLGALKILFYRYSGQEDILIGSSISNRNRPELEGLIGFMVNTLVLRSTLSAETVLYDYLRQLRDTCREAYDNQELPFEKLIESLPIDQDPSRHPIFQIFFTLRNVSGDKLEVPGLRCSTIDVDTGSSKFDMNIYMQESEEEINGFWEYNTDLYKEETIKRMYQHFLILLEAIPEQSGQSLGALPMLSEKERQQLLIDWNQTEAPYEKQQCLQTLIERQVEQNSKAAATIFEGKSLTYEALNRQANQLARHLIATGVQIGDRVGLCMEPSLELPVAILSILKAGAAYVPLDANYPEERLNRMLKDAEIQVLLTLERLLPKLPEGELQRFAIDNRETAKQWIDQDDTNLGRYPGMKSTNTAYMIYTSGSTGEPKGVLCHHQGAINMLTDCQNRVAPDENSRCALWTSISFDVSVYEIFAPLLIGGTLYPIPSELRMNEQELFAWLDENRITGCYLPGFYLKNYLNWLRAGKGRSYLRRLLVGVEPIPETLLIELRQAVPNLQIINGYGPSETHICSTLYDVGSELPKEGNTPIGIALQNTRLYVLDSALNPVPQGVPGELFIAGDGVSNGYHNRPKLTAERFLNDPFTKTSDTLMYRTGDRVRYREERVLEFIGRVDRQIKFRGFRIELGDIESILLRQEKINEAVVVVRKDTIGEKRLVAYIVKEQLDAQNEYDHDEIALIEELHQNLRTALPEYMVPSALVLLNAMPVTRNGKIDRKALPEPETFSTGTAEYVPPKTETEKLLAKAWQEVLGLERVGVNDDFFRVGGHSILAVQLINHIRETTGLEIVLKDLFEKPTIAQLALQVKTGEGENSTLPSLIIDRENRHEPFPLSDVQQAYWLGRTGSFELGNVGTHIYSETPVADLNPERFEEALNKMIQRHEMLRMVVTEDGEQKILPQVPPFKVSVLDMTKTEEKQGMETFRQWREELSHQLFSGHEWPLFDVRLTRFADSSWKIHYSMDALVMDGSSHNIAFGEFLAHYIGEEKQLPELELSFRDYMLVEKRVTETERYKKAKEYWVNRADTIPAAPELAIEQTGLQKEKPHFERRTLTLNRNRWATLKRKAQEIGVTPTVLLLGVYGEILKQWSKSPHFTLNLTLFNRMPVHEQIGQIIGDFTSLTMLEMDYRERTSFIDQLKLIQGQLWSDLEQSLFSGVEVQREISRISGETVTIPVVFTSTLGIEEQQSSELLEIMNGENLPEHQQPYTITQTSQVWLDHQVSEIDGMLIQNWDFVEGLFPEGMIDSMLAAYEALLTDLLERETAWTEPFRFDLPKQQKRSREQANATEGEGSDLLMHQLFQSSVKNSPENVAIYSDRKTLTYAELNRVANQIARKLREADAKPNQLVAIVMEKGWEQIAAALGIQIAGAAYLPVDATMPEERIERILEIGEVRSVLSVSSVLDRLNLRECYTCLTVDQLDESVEVEPVESIQKPEDIAYVIFTSGSTGEPKGVVIDHRGAVNTILDVNRRFRVTERDRAMGLSSLSFDLSVYDIYGLLAVGGAIVLPAEEERRDPVSWLRYLNKWNVTIWNTVPALMQMLVEVAEDRDEKLNLRTVLMSGDWIPVDLPNRIRSLNDQVEITSLGGATEASIWSILYPIEEVDSSWKSIPYGKPMVNQSFHVLKEDLTNAPEWVPGELYIGGIGLAKGYWRDREKTDNSFITHPTTGERLYKTGDMGRYLPDGNIEFMGRNDFQVKIQGYRIELGEIETTLNRHEKVRESVVSAFDAGRNTKQLAAWIVVDQQQKPENSDNVGELQTAGNSITDKQERALFKMEQRGVRNTEGDQNSVSLILPKGDSLRLETRDRDHEALSLSEESLSFESFSGLFESMLQKRFEAVPLPKYYYPSAGSLYPVQIYLSIKPNRVEGVPGGCWYYHRAEHRLDRLSKNAEEFFGVEEVNNTAFALYLVADLDAIEPLYGKYARDFCFQEGGYMAQLLENSAPLNLALKKQAVSDQNSLTKPFELKRSHLLLHAWYGGICSAEQGEAITDPDQTEMDETFNSMSLGYEERKSYRSFQQSSISFEAFLMLLNQCRVAPTHSAEYSDNLRILFFTKADRIEGLEAGVYHYDPDSETVMMLNQTESAESVFSGSELIYQEAGFGIFIVGSSTSQNQTTHRDRDNYLAGYMGQSMMNFSTKKEIGLCAIGIVNRKIAQSTLALNADDEVLHSFLGGKVEQERIHKLDQVAENQNPQTMVSNYLREKLPHYMVPKEIYFIDSIPKSSNGKIDRKQLIQMRKPQAIEETITPLENETEEKIAEIWRSILNLEHVGSNQNFFELGGDSLLMIRLFKGLNEAFDQEISISKLFQFATIKKQAEFYGIDIKEEQRKKVEEAKAWAEEVKQIKGWARRRRKRNS